MRSRTKSLLACLIGVALAVPAIAQQSGSVTQYPACPDPPPKLSKAEFDAAHAAYNVAMEAYAASDYQKALDNFKEAFRRDCSKVSLLDFIARVYEGKGDRAEAVHALETYLQRNPKAPDADTVQSRIQNLRALMQQSATSAPTTTATATSTATVTATATATAIPTAPPTATVEVGGHTAGPWVVAGLGAAAIVPGVVILFVGKGKVDSARQGCLQFNEGANNCLPSDPLDGSSRGAVDSLGATLENVGWVVASVGLAAAIAGLVWHFVEPTGVKTTATSLVPLMGPGYAGLSFGAKF
jgi:tetratricopeptide (TPR) repeat protein